MPSLLCDDSFLQHEAAGGNCLIIFHFERSHLMSDSIHPLNKVARGLRVLYYALVSGLLILMSPIVLTTYGCKMEGGEFIAMLTGYVLGNLLYMLVVFPVINLFGRSICLMNFPHPV